MVSLVSTVTPNGITCIYRYADVLLMYAEASTRATNSVNAQALDAIQKVQKRAGYAQDQLTTTTDPTAFTTAVFNDAVGNSLQK